MLRSPSRATAALLISVVAVVPFLNLACTREAPKAVSTVKSPLTPALFETGRRLYETQCASCHGLRGAGDGPAAYLLYPKPRDFTQNEFRLVSTNSMQATDEDLFLTITRGMPGSAMPSWETLNPEQRWALVYYVRHLTGVNEPVDPASIIQVPAETAKTPEGIERGRGLFAQACASCHGSDAEYSVASSRAGYELSIHKTGGNAFYSNGGGCQKCHTNEGFVKFVKTGETGEEAL